MTMDGFQSASSLSARAADRNIAAPEPTAQAAWTQAMRRFQRSLTAIKTAMAAHAVVEQAMFATRRALETLPFPPCLTVVTTMEVCIKDGLQPPLHRTSSRETRLISEGDIAAYAGNDENLYTRMREALQDYNRQHGILAGAYERAKTIADAKYAASSAAINRSDALQLDLLRTPSPTFKELCWKIEALHRADCNEQTERDGWAFVLAELSAFQGKVSGLASLPS